MIKKLILKSNYSRNVLTLMTGTTVAQAIPIAMAPILTRIYTPDDFGLFAFYFGIVSIFSVIATARYELAIVLPKRRGDAYQIVLLSLLISLLVSILTLFLILLLEKKLIVLLNNESITSFIYLIPLSIFLMGINQSLYYWFNREQSYKKMANSRVVQSLTAVISQISLGVLSKLAALGLILGQVIGQIVAVIFMGYLFIKDTRNIYKPNKLKQLSLAKRYIDFPKFLVMAHTMNATSRQLPNILFNLLFTVATAGFYLLIQRTLVTPISIVSGAIGDVFRQQASKAYVERGECITEYKKTFKKLLMISFVPFVAFFFIAPNLFSVVFGENWKIAGEYAQILTPMFFLQFLTSPLSNMFMIAEKQKADLYWQASLLFSTGLAFTLGYFYKDVYFTIVFFSASYTLMYAINALMTWQFAKGRNRQIISSID